MGIRTSGPLIVLLLSCPFPMRGEEPTAGSVKTLQGAASILRGGKSLACREGMHILTKDVLRTEANGRVGIIFRDGTRVAIGPDTELSVDRFVFEPVGGQFGLFLRLIRGVAAYVSGKIAQFSPDGVRIETPVGIIGLRGTQFAVSLDQP